MLLADGPFAEHKRHVRVCVPEYIIRIEDGSRYTSACLVRARAYFFMRATSRGGGVDGAGYG